MWMQLWVHGTCMGSWQYCSEICRVWFSAGQGSAVLFTDNPISVANGVSTSVALGALQRLVLGPREGTFFAVPWKETKSLLVKLADNPGQGEMEMLEGTGQSDPDHLVSWGQTHSVCSPLIKYTGLHLETEITGHTHRRSLCPERL